METDRQTRLETATTEQPATAQEDPKAKATRWPVVHEQRAACPNCRSRDTRTNGTETYQTVIIRYRKCNECGQTFRSDETL